MRRSAVLLAMVYGGLLASHGWWEDSMHKHMGMLLPILIILGACAALLLRRAWPGLMDWGQRYRFSLFLFTLFTIMLWMLPRLLDASLYQREMAYLKWLSLPLAGMTLTLSWRYLPWLLRAVLHLEAIATLLRLGWLYMAAPQQYCVSYGIDDQQRLGELLIVYAAIYAGALGLKLLFVGDRSLD